jgi:hypothetical protein
MNRTKRHWARSIFSLLGALTLMGAPAAYAGYCLETPRGETQSCVCDSELECQFMMLGCAQSRGRWQCYQGGLGGGCSLAVCTLKELVSEPDNMSRAPSPASPDQLMSPVEKVVAPGASAN